MLSTLIESWSRKKTPKFTSFQSVVVTDAWFINTKLFDLNLTVWSYTYYFMVSWAMLNEDKNRILPNKIQFRKTNLHMIINKRTNKQTTSQPIRQKKKKDSCWIWEEANNHKNCMQSSKFKVVNGRKKIENINYWIELQFNHNKPLKTGILSSNNNCTRRWSIHKNANERKNTNVID